MPDKDSPWPGIEPRPWHCKYRILTPGLPGNVLIWHILKGLFRLLFWEKPGRAHAFKQGSQLGGDGNNFLDESCCWRSWDCLDSGYDLGLEPPEFANRRAVVCESEFKVILVLSHWKGRISVTYKRGTGLGRDIRSLWRSWTRDES